MENVWHRNGLFQFPVEGNNQRTVLNVLGIFVKRFEWHEYTSYSTSTGDGVEMPLVDKHDDDEDEHNCCWVVAYLQEDNMHSVVDLREHRKTFHWLIGTNLQQSKNEIQKEILLFTKAIVFVLLLLRFRWLTQKKCMSGCSYWSQSIGPGRVCEAVNSFYLQNISLICDQSPAVNPDMLTCGFGTKGLER